VFAVVLRVDADDALELAAVEDEEAVEALTAQASGFLRPSGYSLSCPWYRQPLTRAMLAIRSYSFVDFQGNAEARVP
jgi:hypothetical protein